MSKLRCIIIDDEYLARLNVIDALKNFPSMEVVEEFNSADIPLETLSAIKPDVIFLDIEMPKINGIDFAHSLSNLANSPKVVFITAYDEYAVQAFELHAIDYLLKPFDDKRFAKTISRIIESDTNSSNNRVSYLKEFENSKNLERLIIKTTGAIRIINIDEVTWLHSCGNYVEVHHAEGKHLHRVTLSFLENHLDSSVFIRTHRTAIVRKADIREIISHDENKSSIILSNGDQVPLSKTYRETLLSLLETH